MILFLDFDGVTHPQFPRDDLTDEENKDFSFAPRLEAVLRDFPDVKVVISSAWRQRHTLAQLRGFFAPDIAERIVGVTPVEQTNPAYKPFPVRGIRSREARAWLNETGQPNTKWIALEDNGWNWLATDPVILCDDGFHEAEEAALRAALQAMQ